MNIVCDRCPAAAGCCLDFGGKTCKSTAKKHGFDPTPTNYEKIRSMSFDEIADLITEIQISEDCDFCEYQKKCKRTDTDGCKNETKSTSDLIREWLDRPSE